MRQQDIRYTASGAAAVTLVLALVIMVNWLAAHKWIRADWTSTQMYSLSAKTVNILAELEEEIRVVVFMTPASGLYDQVSELLNRYASESRHIEVEYIDPDREPLKTRQLAEEFGISVANTVVFSYGDRSKYVTSDELADFDYAGMQYGQGPTMRGFKGEEQFTAAILSLVAPGVPKIYLVSGHGEATTSGGGGVAERSLAVFAEALKRENMEVENVSLLGGTVPEDADALAIIGPTQPYAEAEIELLDEYLDGGGRLLVALDPLIDPSAVMRQTRLEGLLGGWGVEVHDDLVVDPSRRLPFFDLSAVYLQDFQPHPVTTGLEGVAVLFPVARSLAPVSGDGWTAEAVVETSAEGWGETDLGQLLRGEAVEAGDSDTAGPAAVVVVVSGVGGDVEVELPEDGSTPEESVEAAPADGQEDFRLAAFGDSDFLADSEISNAGNLTLAVNAVTWLVAREETLGIPPREVEQVSLYLSRDQLRLMLLTTIILMPGAVIVVGVVVWRRRRH